MGGQGSEVQGLGLGVEIFTSCGAWEGAVGDLGVSGTVQKATRILRSF